MIIKIVGTKGKKKKKIMTKGHEWLQRLRYCVEV